jgi:hypothetical protein
MDGEHRWTEGVVPPYKKMFGGTGHQQQSITMRRSSHDKEK